MLVENLLKKIIKELDLIKSTMATKSDFKAVKSDLEIVKGDVENVKSDLKAVKSTMATKSDLEIVKGDVENVKSDLKAVKEEMATKSDLKAVKSTMATKKDLLATEKRISDQLIEGDKIIISTSSKLHDEVVQRLDNLELNTPARRELDVLKRKVDRYHSTN